MSLYSWLIIRSKYSFCEFLLFILLGRRLMMVVPITTKVRMSYRYSNSTVCAVRTPSFVQTELGTYNKKN